MTPVRSLTAALRRHVAALRVLVLMTVVTGVAYPLAILAVAQIPGLQHKADGSLVTAAGRTVGSRELGQSFTDAKGNPVVWYIQSRPSAAGATGYDPTATSASNLGPESTVDTLPDPKTKGDTGKQSLLTQVCTRSLAVGQLEHVSGARPFCTAGGVGAVLSVIHSNGTVGPVVKVVSVNEACPTKPFVTTWDGVRVSCATFGEDYSTGVITPVRGSAPAHPTVPSDAVTASASGLDPDISPAYARLQAPRVAAARRVGVAQVLALVSAHTRGRTLGFLGEPSVNVLELNLALDRQYPHSTA